MIFPEYLKTQNLKLSAAGTDLISMFKVCAGFSGTVNGVLPMDLGEVKYEKGTDAEVIYNMTTSPISKVVELSDFPHLTGNINHKHGNTNDDDDDNTSSDDDNDNDQNVK
eukprot:UN03398